MFVMSVVGRKIATFHAVLQLQPLPPRTGLTKEWAASMWPIIGQIYILQINLIMDIGMHEAVGNPMAARSRVLQLLSEWQTFIGNNQQKALEGALAGLQSRLYWSRTSKKDCPSYNPRCKDYKNTQKGKCELDACEKMNCVNMGQTWKCRTRVTKCNPSGSKQVCESSQDELVLQHLCAGRDQGT